MQRARLPIKFRKLLITCFAGSWDERPIPEERVERGTGSDSVQDGHLLTNAHVVAEAGTVQVTLRMVEVLRERL